jgi:glycosyltransferase involved in cell wall biosynthesis
MAADNEALAAHAEAIGKESRAELRAELKTRGVLFLYVGQLIKRKGLAQLLEAWARFEKQDEGTLAIVGGGPEAGNLQKQAQRLGLGRVRFVGPVDYQQLPAYYAAADAFIIPTLEDNWSLVVPEAMACGLPILCSRYNGCWPELVKAGQNGWIFDPLDLKDTLRCLEACLRRSGELATMGQASKAILTGHIPRLAAEAIFKTCHMAIQVRNGWKDLSYLSGAQGSREI